MFSPSVTRISDEVLSSLKETSLSSTIETLLASVCWDAVEAWEFGGVNVSSSERFTPPVFLLADISGGSQEVVQC